MDGNRFSSQGCCLTVVWKWCRDGLYQYVDLCFHASSLPCSQTFWHAIPTSFYIFIAFFLFSCFYTFLVLTSVTARPKWFSFTWKLTTVLRQLHDHPSITKAAGRLFLSIAISKQLNAAPYLQHKPWQLLPAEKSMPAVRYRSTCDFTCALVLLPDQWLWSLVWERDYVCTCVQH